MSEWRGLANSEWHDPNRRAQGWAWCEGDCNTTCHKDALCRCCLAAEVERLTALLKAADDVVASQDRRIAAALARCDRQIEVTVGAWSGAHVAQEVARILRGGGS